MTQTEVARAGVEDAVRVRAVRLAALADAPDAFWTTLAEDEARPLQEWRGRLADPAGATFLAVRAGLDVGMAVGRPCRNVDGEAGLYGMWVAPAARRAGAGRALISAVLDWARAAGYPRLRLEVADVNAPAIATYAALGFTATGRRGEMPPPRAHITEHELAVDLASVRAGST